MNNKEIESFFTTDKYLESNLQEVLEIIKKYINNKPLYLNEIRNFLNKNDKILYQKYADCFKHNSGITVAFNTQFEKSNFKSFLHVKKFETYKPVISKDIDKKSNNNKIKINKLKQINKNETKLKSKRFREEKNLNEKKIIEIRKRIRKS